MGDVAGERHMDLLAWTMFYPHEALAVILELLDKTENDEDIQESIALSEVDHIVESPTDDFLPYLVYAIQTHHAFALCTKWNREHSESSRWKKLQEEVTRKA